jgi:hypothetical protein
MYHYTAQRRQSARLFLLSPESPAPFTPYRVCHPPPPPLVPGGNPALGGEGVGGPNSDEGTDTVVIYSYICTFVFSSLPSFVCIQKINSTMHTLQEVKESKGTSVSVFAFESIILDVQGHPSYIQIIL